MRHAEGFSHVSNLTKTYATVRHKRLEQVTGSGVQTSLRAAEKATVLAVLVLVAGGLLISSQLSWLRYMALS